MEKTTRRCEQILNDVFRETGFDIENRVQLVMVKASMKIGAWLAWKQCLEIAIKDENHTPTETDLEKYVRPAFEQWWNEEIPEKF